MIVGLAGRMGSGKTLLSSALIERGFIKIAFADHLKWLLAETYNIDINLFKSPEGKSEILSIPLIWDDIIAKKLFEIANINDFNLPIETKSFSSRRELMQYVGSDVLRKYDDNYHVKTTLALLDADKDYVIDDFRFKNELDSLNALGAYTCFVLRPDNFNISNHISETSLNWSDFQNHLINNQSASQVVNKFLESLKYIDYTPIKKPNHIILTKDLYYYDRSTFMYPSKEAAYYAGLLSADGCIKQSGYAKQSYVMELSSNDYCLVDGLRKFFKSDKPLFSNNYAENKTNYTFTIVCPFIIENLKRWNLKPRKSKHNEIPDIIKDNKDLLNYWLLGLIDGDGTIGIYNNRLHLGILASKEIIIFCKKTFKSLRGCVRQHKNHNKKHIDNLYEWTLAHKDTIALYNEIYDPIALNRKWDKIKSFIKS